MDKTSLSRISPAGIVIALGIIYGDIGTSPLYVFNAIVEGRTVDGLLVLGSLSCIIWTLTLQTTIKYVILTLKADNRGEGGIFSLYALVRRRRKWLVYPAMIGGAALLADGMITPPISVTSAVEGLRLIPEFSDLGQMTVVYIVMGILGILFLLQQFGTPSIGKLFGPIMLIWFTMLGVLGLRVIPDHWAVFRALDPSMAVRFLIRYPGGFWLLGAVFLCTTGAEALYSDLGHCGRDNIRSSWVFVKTCLILNYLGQGAYLLSHPPSRNAFFAIMPESFRIIGILIATIATVIASQALISGSFTLISEAARLNLWPKMKIRYPSEERGQLFIPGINFLLWVGCSGIVIYFRSSSNMGAAYGLAITLCMLSTSVLFANFLVSRRVKARWIYLYLCTYLMIEGGFLSANLNKFKHGGFVTLIVGGLLFGVMYVWYRSRKIRNRYIEFVRLEHYVPLLQELSHDQSVPKFATHLIFMTSANNPKEVEHKIMYSILYRKPKRADIYWFIHVDILDDPYTCEYVVEPIVPGEIIRIEFRFGFRVQQRIQLMFRKVVEDMVLNKEVNIVSRYDSLQRNRVVGDFQFIVLEKFLSQDNDLAFWERVIMQAYFFLKMVSLSEERGFGLDPSNVSVEKIPLVVTPVTHLSLRRARH